MTKVRYHTEGELPEEPERAPKTVLKSDNPSTGKIDLVTSAHDLASETLAEIGAQAAVTAEDIAAWTEDIRVDNGNEFGLGAQVGVVRPIRFPEFTTKQQAYRFAAWLLLMAEHSLEDEPHPHTFEEITEAIKRGH